MTTLYYVIGVLFLFKEVNVLTDLNKRRDLILLIRTLSESKDKKIVQDNIGVIGLFFLIELLYLIWGLVGLFTFQWKVFLLFLLFGLVMGTIRKKNMDKTNFLAIDSFVSSCFLLYIIFNGLNF